MYREQSIAYSAQLKIFCTEQERRDGIVRPRHQSPDAFDLISAGERAQKLLLSLHRSMCIEASNVHPMPSSRRGGFPALNKNIGLSDLVNRATAGRRVADVQ
jgi:hypothetical protein